jgi:type IV secretion system protein VirB11
VTSGGGVYLRSYLAAFESWLERPDVTDILVNRPGEVWIETVTGAMTRHDAPDLTETMLARLAQQIAAAASQGVSREQPLLAASLPGGARVQIVAPPATRGPLALAIRKHVVHDISLAAFAAEGAFVGVRQTGLETPRQTDPALAALLADQRLEAFFAAAVRAKLTILVSGGTGAGKTTFLNALLKEVPETERLLVIEDTPEVRLDRPNAVGLIAVKGDMGEARVGIDDLMQAALRMRPDRLLVGEVRGAEAFSFLRAINTGHPGSITTIHADSPRGALEQLAFMGLQAGMTLTRPEIIAYARETIDVIVQLSRRDGRRCVSEVTLTRPAA